MRPRPLLLAASAATGVVLAAAAPASSAPAASGAPAPSAARHSRRFAGWIVSGTQTGFTMDAGITAPKLKCTRADRAIAPSVGGFYGTGSTDFSEAAVFVGCIRGKPHYWPAFVLNGTVRRFPKLKIQPGDTVILSANLNSTQTTLSVDDKTKFSKTLTGAGVTGTRSPWVGDSGWYTSSGALEGVPRFGKISFNGIFFDSTELGTHLGLKQFDRYKGSTLQIVAGAITNQETFETVFKHS